MTGRMRRALLLTILCAIASAGFATTASAKKLPSDFFGVVLQEFPSNNDFSRMADAHAGTVRIPFHFNSVQQVDGNCQAEAQVGVCSWTVLDGIVGLAAQGGTRVLPTLTADKPPLHGSLRRKWKAFLVAAAKRYGPGGFFWQAQDQYGYGGPKVPITHWQVWNEPNSKQFWPGNPDAGEYARLLKASAKSLRKGDRNADIVLAGMFADAKVPIVPYLRDLYRVGGIERFFDAIALHPYAPTVDGLKRQIRMTRRAAKRNGDKNVGLRLTELGWSSAKGGHPLMKGLNGQARLLRKSFELLRKRHGKWNIDGVSYYALRDSRNGNLCRFCKKSGLLNNNGNPKPAFKAFKRIAN